MTRNSLYFTLFVGFFAVMCLIVYNIATHTPPKEASKPVPRSVTTKDFHVNAILFETCYTHIREYEGYDRSPYVGSSGDVIIGIGRNLTTTGLSAMEASQIFGTLHEKPVRFVTLNAFAGKLLTDADIQLMFRNDVRRAAVYIIKHVPNFNSLSVARQTVLIDMCFELGTHGFDEFVEFRKDVIAENWTKAATEMLNSKAAKESPKRWKANAAVMGGN